MSKKLKRSHIVLDSWMFNDLELSGPEMIVYAAIYGFSQDGTSMFFGSRDYLATWAGVKTRKIQYILNDLVEKEYIIKFDIPNSKTKGYMANLQLIEEMIRKREYEEKSHNEFAHDNACNKVNIRVSDLEKI